MAGSEGLGRMLVLLGEEDIETDRRRTLRRDCVEQCGQPIARPRPLSDRGQAVLVDVHQYYLFADILSRPQGLQSVEYLQADGLDLPRVADTQRQDRDQDQDRSLLPAPEIEARPTRAKPVRQDPVQTLQF